MRRGRLQVQRVCAAASGAGELGAGRAVQAVEPPDAADGAFVPPDRPLVAPQPAYAVAPPDTRGWCGGDVAHVLTARDVKCDRCGGPIREWSLQVALSTCPHRQLIDGWCVQPCWVDIDALRITPHLNSAVRWDRLKQPPVAHDVTEDPAPPASAGER